MLGFLPPRAVGIMQCKNDRRIRNRQGYKPRLGSAILENHGNEQGSWRRDWDEGMPKTFMHTAKS